MGAGGSSGPPALQRGGSLVLEPADQLGGGVVGGHLAGQPDVDLDRGMVVRANVNGVGPAEDHQPDRLGDQQAEQVDGAGGADWTGGIKRAQPPCPALIDADGSSAVARSPDRGGRNQLTQRFQFLPSCRSFIGLALCTGHPPIHGGHLPATGPLLPSCRSLIGLALCTGCPPIYPACHAGLPSLGMASHRAIRVLAAAAERLRVTARCRQRTHRKTRRLSLGGCTGGGRVSQLALVSLVLVTWFARLSAGCRCIIRCRDYWYRRAVPGWMRAARRSGPRMTSSVSTSTPASVISGMTGRNSWGRLRST
jgi:hypothetical protein